jgi:hypothetical protein
LVKQIAMFFRTGEVPIDPNETIELYAFMQAAAESHERSGSPVEISEVLKQAEEQATVLLADKL